MDEQIELFCTAAFCIAWADSDCTIVEKKKAKQVVVEFFIPEFHEKYHEILALIDATFDHLETTDCRGEKGFEKLKTLVQSTKEPLDVQVKKKLIDCCIAVASATNRLNKAELVLLSRLENLLK